ATASATIETPSATNSMAAIPGEPVLSVHRRGTAFGLCRAATGVMFAGAGLYCAHGAQAQSLRSGPGPEPRQPCPVDAALVHRALGACFSRSALGRAWCDALHLERDLCALPAARLRARTARDRQGRHGRGDAAEHPGDVRGAFRRAD